MWCITRHPANEGSARGPRIAREPAEPSSSRWGRGGGRGERGQIWTRTYRLDVGTRFDFQIWPVTMLPLNTIKTGPDAKGHKAYVVKQVCTH
jgi:hypothetical protein